MKTTNQFFRVALLIVAVSLTLFGMVHQVIHVPEYQTAAIIHQHVDSIDTGDSELAQSVTATYEQPLMLRAVIERQQYVQAIVAKYPVTEYIAEKIVQAAQQNQQPVFPRTKDILAIIGIESSFRHNVSSKLASDPAVGLMQVRPGVWKTEIHPSMLTHIEGQIKAGAYVLTRYYQDTHSKLGAVMAYNVGITAYRRGKTNWRYVNKYRDELQWLGETHE